MPEHGFSLTRIFSYKGGIVRVRENLYSAIFYAIYSLTYKQIYGYSGVSYLGLSQTSMIIDVWQSPYATEQLIFTSCVAIHLADALRLHLVSIFDKVFQFFQRYSQTYKKKKKWILIFLGWVIITIVPRFYIFYVTLFLWKVGLPAIFKWNILIARWLNLLNLSMELFPWIISN